MNYVSKVLDADDWIRGWERPLQKVVMRAIVADRPSSADLTAVFDDFFSQVNRSLDAHARGPEAFDQLLRLIHSHFDHGDGSAAFQRLQTFGVANGTPFSVFFSVFQRGRI